MEKYLLKNSYIPKEIKACTSHKDHFNNRFLGTDEKCAANESLKTMKIDVKCYDFCQRYYAKQKSLLNKPTRLRIIGFGNYGNSSTTSLVAYSEYHKACVPIDTEMFAEAMVNCGADEEGYLKCEFILASIKGKQKFIRTNGSLHKAILVYEENKKKTKVDEINFVVGDVYKTAGGTCGVFLGCVTTTDYVGIRELSKYDYPTAYEEKVIEKAYLWYDLNERVLLETKPKEIKRWIKHASVSRYLKFRKVNKFTTKIDMHIPLEASLIQDLSVNAYSRIKENIKTISSRSKDHWSYKSLRHDVSLHAKIANMSLYGMHVSFNKKEDIKKILIEGNK